MCVSANGQACAAERVRGDARLRSGAFRATNDKYARDRRIMKIEGRGKATGAQPADGAHRPRAPADAPDAVVEPAASAAIAGIPDNELTPRVRAALSALMQEVAELRRELISTRFRLSDLEAMAASDPLLGVLNRRAFVGALSRTLAMVERHGQPASLVFIDVDALKSINDARGHAAGDAALAHVAASIAAHIRQTDVLARIGGDEFAIILANAEETAARAKAAQLAQIVAQSAPEDAPVSISWGVAGLAPGVTAEAAMRAADARMYEAKPRR